MRLSNFLGLCLGVLLVPVKVVSAENLADVYRMALIHDARFQAARSEYLAAREALPQARGAYLPNIAISYEHIRTDQEIISSDNEVFGQGKSSFPTSNLSLVLTQPIFRYESFMQVKQARASVKEALARYTAAEQDLMLRAAEAYMGVLASHDALSFARAELKAVGRHFESARKRLEVGLGTMTDVHDAKARHESVMAQVLEAESSLDDAFEALRESTGRADMALAPVKKDILLQPPNPESIDRWMRLASAQNLSLQERKYAVEVARHDVGRQQAGHYPTLDLVGSTGRRDSEGSLFGGGSEVDTTDVMLRLNVPLYAGGQVSSRVRQARHRFQQAIGELEVQDRVVRRQTRSAYLGIISGISKVKALGEAVAAQDLALRARYKGFEAGINTNLEVLDAERDLHLARRDLAQARYDYLVNVLRLKQSIGSLQPMDLARINDMLEAGGAKVSLAGQSVGALEVATLPNTGFASPTPDSSALAGSGQSVPDPETTADAGTGQLLGPDQAGAQGTGSGIARRGRVTVRSLRIRQTAATTAPQTGQLAREEVVEILAEEDGWYRIEAGSRNGFVMARYLQVED